MVNITKQLPDYRVPWTQPDGMNNPIWYRYMSDQATQLNIISPSQGGTGIANFGTLTIGGNYNLILTLINDTAVTIPSSGTLLQNTGGNVSSASTFRTNISAAQSGANADITSLSSGAISIPNGNLSVSAGTITGTAISSAGNHNITAIGGGMTIKEGTNARLGTVTLSSGIASIVNTSVTVNTRIFVFGQDTSVTGFLKITARTNGSGFSITSSVLSDSGVIAYLLVEAT